MSTRLRGPPKPRDKKGPDPLDAWTFLTFVAMMLVISSVIIGAGGVLHGFPTFSGPVEPEDASDDAGNGTDETAKPDAGSAGGTDGDDSDERNDGEPLFGGDDEPTDASDGAEDDLRIDGATGIETGGDGEWWTSDPAVSSRSSTPSS